MTDKKESYLIDKNYDKDDIHININVDNNIGNNDKNNNNSNIYYNKDSTSIIADRCSTSNSTLQSIHSPNTLSDSLGLSLSNVIPVSLPSLSSYTSSFPLTSTHNTNNTPNSTHNNTQNNTHNSTHNNTQIDSISPKIREDNTNPIHSQSYPAPSQIIRTDTQSELSVLSKLFFT